MWDLRSGRMLERLGGHLGVVYQAVWNNAQSVVASCSDDRLAKTWWFDESKPLAEDGGSGEASGDAGTMSSAAGPS